MLKSAFVLKLPLIPRCLAEKLTAMVLAEYELPSRNDGHHFLEPAGGNEAPVK